MSETNLLNEFRQDLVSGDWVLFATGRSKRPHESENKKYENSYQPKEGCPFENPKASDQEIVGFYPSEENWSVSVIKNKYPAVKQGACLPMRTSGPYEVFDAVGFHEIVVTRDHDKDFADLELDQISEVFKVFRDRYIKISEYECGNYISIFHNHGKEAGASIYHPHSQIISTPILPPYIMRSIRGSEDFYEKNNKKVYDVMIEYEVEQKKRIVEENEKFLAFCPFVSKKPYEIRIFPKKSNPRFEKISDEEILYLSSILKSVLNRMNRLLNNPPFFFFIHTATVKELSTAPSQNYHWHIEIVPCLTIDAGFQAAAGIEINITDPDKAAEDLRKI